MDILAAIASDPSALPLWLVLAFAAGMYPVGMLFGCEICCNYCLQCCPDRPEQVVIDFHLEEAGEQVVKESPWRTFTFTQSGNYYFRHDPFDDIEGTQNHIALPPDVPVENMYSNIPTFIATGDSSGAKVMLGTQQFGEQVSPRLVAFTNDSMGDATATRFGTFYGYRATDFLDETVTIQTIPPVTETNPSAITATRVNTELGCGLALSGDVGLYELDAAPEADYKVFCQGDEGTIIYDITDGRPDGCNVTCIPQAHRLMSHPASCRLVGGIFDNGFIKVTDGNIAEQSSLDISVGVLVRKQEFGSFNSCNTTLTATATTGWSSVLPSPLRLLPNTQLPDDPFDIQTTQAYCSTVRTYTLNTNEQDCAPFENWPYTEVTTDSDGEYEDNLVLIKISSCFGSGFSGRATEPAGIPGQDEGPITAVEITNAGTGYAVPGRVEPTIIVSSVAGIGADLLVTMTEGEDECGRPVWSIDSIQIASGSGDDGGQDYIDGENLSITVEAPGVEVTAAAGTAVVAREEPEVEFYSLNGSNAEITFTYTENAGPPKTWTPNAATVDSVGSGYVYGEYVSLFPKTAADHSANEYSLGLAQIETLVSEPTVSLSGGSGSGADLPVTLASNGGAPETWGISAVTILDGGSGYVEGDILSIERGEDDVEQSAATVTVSAVDGGGAITGVTIDSAGEYYYESGHVSAVNILAGGEYYRLTGILEGVEITEPGAFYLEDEDAPAIVADITVEIEQVSPSAGSGLEVSAVVDDDVHSATFGQIAGLTIDDGGSNYLAIHEEPRVCHVGAPYRRTYAYMGFNQQSFTMFEADNYSGDPANKPRRGFLFRRRCPDYTYDISLQSGSS